MKSQDIYSVLGIAPSTLSDWSKESNKKYTLAKLLQNISLEDVQKIINAKQASKQKPMMLLSTVNCSIGNKKKHFTLTKLKQLFYKQENLDTYEKYALKVMKQEAIAEEIGDFAKYYKISPKRINTVLASL